MPPPENPKVGPGRKKPNLALVPPSAVIYLSTAFMDGAEKYGPYNWRKTGVSMMVYLRALNSHYQLYLDGQDYDPKTKVHHLAYVMANCAIILDGMSKEGVLVDDRPPPGAAAELTERFVEQGHLMFSPSLVLALKGKIMHNDVKKKLDDMVSNLEAVYESLSQLVNNPEYARMMDPKDVQRLRTIRHYIGQDLNSAYAAQRWDDRDSREGERVYQALLDERTRRAQSKE